MEETKIKLIVSADTCYQINPKFLHRDIAGETILIPTGEAALKFNGMATLNGTGAFLWNCLSEKKTPVQLAQQLAQKYEIDLETSQTDVNEFLEHMIEYDLIIAENQK